MPMSQNRTRWPYQGGALSIQPGWFPGHQKALIYVNIGINEPGQDAPPNMSHPVVPPFQLVSPSNLEYPGQFCLPQIGMPANLSLAVGDNITLQVIETAQHGAALYNVSSTRTYDWVNGTELTSFSVSILHSRNPKTSSRCIRATVTTAPTCLSTSSSLPKPCRAVHPA